MAQSITEEKTRRDVLGTESLPALIDPKKAACLLGVTPRTITRLCAAGEIKAVRIAKRWRINRDALLKQYGLN